MDLQSLKIDRRPSGGPKRRNPWPARLVVLALLAGLLWAFWTPAQRFLDRINLPEVRSYLVTEASAAALATVRGTAANGYVVAARRAALSSDVPGRIVELNVREGSVVKAGEIVARLYSDEYRAALLRAAADLAAARARQARAVALVAERAADLKQIENAEAASRAHAAEAAAELRYATAEEARQQELAAKGIGSKRELERAVADLATQQARQQSRTADLQTARLASQAARQRLATSRADVQVAQAETKAAEANHAQAKATLDKTDVRAPFDGIVVLKDAEIGEVVSPNVQGGSNARGAVCTMVDFASLEVQAHVPETALGSVKVGAPVDVFLDAYPDERLEGRVDRIWPTADRSKATVEVRILVTERERLRPEYGVRVVFRRDAKVPLEASTKAPKRIVIPEAAIVEVEGVPTAFVIERDTVRASSLKVGGRSKGRATIEAGLRAGQRIVANPPPSLRGGDRIRIASN